MSRSDPRRVVRIAIALAVLKHRPRDQSTASYLLDLQSRFPVTTKHSESRDWRTYALELEKQLATLKTQRDADQELLSKLPTDVSQAASTSDAAPPKKKIKKNPTKDRHDPEWRWDQSRADWSRVLSSQYPSSPSLIAAYGALKGTLAAPNSDLLSYASCLADAILRALDTMHLFLFSPTSPSPDAHAQTLLGGHLLKPEHIDSARIALVSPLIMYFLREALPTLVRTVQDSAKSKYTRQRLHTATLPSADAHAYIDKVLDRLLECVLLPLLRAIMPLCSVRLSPLISPPKRDSGKATRAVGKGKNKNKHTGSASIDPQNETDVRTDVFALIGTSLGALDALPPSISSSGPGGVGAGSIASGIRDRLGLETIRELEALYAIPPAPAPSPLPPASTLQPSSQQQPAAPSEPPPPSNPNPTPPSAQSRACSQPRPQPRAQRGAAPASRANQLERLAGTRAERVRALATRDAGWFLASTLNLCVTPAPAAQTATHGHGVSRDTVAGKTDASGRLLRDALLERVGKLVRSVHTVPLDGPASSDSAGEQQPGNPTDATNSKLAVDPVCRNMLLAICERAMSHLISA